MIDDDRKFIFVENPKTGSYAVKQALLGQDFTFDFGHPRFADINHKTPALIKGKHPDRWENYTSFVVIRNTWDRAFSFYNFYKKIAKAQLYQSMTFEEWLLAKCPPPEEDYLKIPMRAEGRLDDLLCQMRYIEEVDHVIVLHAFDQKTRNQELLEGLQHVMRELDILDKLELPVSNTSRSSFEVTRWSQGAIDAIASLYREEIEYFGFEAPKAW